MIALKNTTNNQIFYIIHRKMDGEQGWDLMPLNVEYTENGQYSVVPPSGFDGFSSVNVTVDVDQTPCKLTTSTVNITEEGEHTITPPSGYDGISEIVVNVDVDCGTDCETCYDEGVADQKAKLTSTTFTENGNYTREDGWNAVQVNVDTVTPYNNGVADQKAKLTSLNVTQNGTYRREDGYNEVVVSVSGGGDCEECRQAGIAEQKSKLTSTTFTQNGNYTREDGWNDVTVNVDTVTPYNNGFNDGVADQKSKLDTLTVTENGVYTREDGWNTVIVNITDSDAVLTTSPVVADLAGGCYNVSIYSSHPWSIVDSSNWVSADISEGTAGPSVMEVCVDTSNEERSGYITLFNGFIYANVPITQIDGRTPLTFTAKSNNSTLQFVALDGSHTRTIEYSVDGGQTWRTVTSSTGGRELATVSAGAEILVRGNNDYYASYSEYGSINWYNYFKVTSGSFDISGNIMSLLSNKPLFETVNRWAFAGLFMGGGNFISAEHLALPSNTIDGCYQDLFFNTALEVAPILPASVMTPYCYAEMFNNTRLVDMPLLPATTLADHCYAVMFSDCNYLANVQELPATTLAPYCYYSMFDGNDSLIHPQQVLPANVLAPHCYEGMYSNCEHMVDVPIINATVLADNCCNRMFYRCLHITTAPTLDAQVLVNGCYNEMFKGCMYLNNVSCYATTFPLTRCTFEWMDGVAASGQFTKADTNWWARTSSGIPLGWTVITH